MRAFVALLGLSVVGFVIWIMNTLLIHVSNGLISAIMSVPIILLALVASIVIAFMAGGGAGISVFIAAVFILGPVQGFNNNVAFNNASQMTVSEVGDADKLSYAERVPYDVAVAVSERSLGNTNGNATGIIKAVPKNKQYTTLVVERGVFKGYESVHTMTLPEYGSFSFNSDIKSCHFAEDAQYRFGGAGFNNNITQHAYWVAAQGFNPFIRILESDSFAVCDGDTPKIYMPATTMKFEGLLTYRVPAGVVIYNGKTNEFSFESEATIDGYSIYPISIAERQRESTIYSSGFWDYLMKRAGYETTAPNPSDEGAIVSENGDDTNASNSTEFVLTNLKNNHTEYVTPLTPRGSSSSVVALSVVEASTVKRGSLNPLNIYQYEQPRQAPSTAASNIVSTVLSGYKANGLTVFEVIPSKDGSWTATIGKNQSILYRAVIDADGKAVLLDADGKSVSVDEVGEEKETVKEPSDSEDNPPVISEGSGKPVSEMTVKELEQMMNEITAELADRAGR